MSNPWQLSKKQSFDERYCVLSTYLILKHLELTLDKTFSTVAYSHLSWIILGCQGLSFEL